MSLEEIKDAIVSLDNRKAPRSDGLPMEFYKKCIDWVGEDLLQVHQEVVDKGSLHEDINTGLIKLLPKDGDKILIRKWRPITLLNVS